MTDSIPAPPDGVGEAGERLWSAVMTDYELAEHEAALLREAVRVADTCSDLQARVGLDGPVLDGKNGPVPHPALVELRQERVLLSRLLVALRVPIGDQEERPSKHDGTKRPQHRGTRGAYGPRGLRGVS
jgi:hypothetical protein